MTDRTCARCNWRPEDDETLAQHAESAEHPLCTACGTSLPSDRPRTCRDCQDRASLTLDEILVMWAELPDLLELHASAALPGGDVLVLAGPGSRGVQGADDLATRREIVDNEMADVPSVAWTLTNWEDDWRHTRGEPASDLPASSAHSVVEAAHAYLVEHGPWAARDHWAWAEYFADLRHVHGSLLRATGRHRGPRVLGLSCFACRGRLQVNVISERDAEPPQSRPRWWVDRHTLGPVDAAEYARRHLGTAGLEEEQATCRGCGQTYTAAALRLAQRQAIEDLQWHVDEDGTRWGTVKAVAEYVQRPRRTVQTWERQGLIRSTRHESGIYVHLADVQAEAELRTCRQRKTS